jgi:hypothetical protein
MLKNRYFTVMLILLVLLTGGILIKADSQIQPAPSKFKVAVHVTCEENLSHQSQLEGTIKRELRGFGDVQIVGDDILNGLWDYRIVVHLVGIKDSYAGINRYATSTSFYKKVPIDRFVPNLQAYYREFPRRFPEVEFPTNYTGVVGIDKLENRGVSTAANFDKNYLQSVRDFRTRFSR